MRFLLLLSAMLLVAAPAAAQSQYEASLIVDLRPGPEGSISPSVQDADRFSPIVYDGRLFFSAYDGETGGLWAHDADTGETTLVADLISPRDPAVYDGRLFFAAHNKESGRELWVYDAVTGEATLAVDINMGSGSSSPQYLTVYDDRLFFNAIDAHVRSRLWAYDAATDEATMVGDVPPEPWFYPFHFTVYDDRLFFSAEDYGNDIGRELWVYDAATDAISLAADLLPGPSRSLGDDLHDAPVVYDNRLFLITYNSRDLWAYDATTDEATLVADIHGSYLSVYDERLFFSSGGLGVYDADADEVTTAAVMDDSGHLTVYDGKLFLSADGEIWAFDAKTGEASLIADINSDNGSYPEGFIEHDGRLFFSADDDVHGRELWVLSPMPVANEPSTAPQSVRLHTPHPNPAQDRATVTFDVAEAGPVRVEVLDVLGRSVALLADGPVAAGEHTLTWEAGTLPSGLYLVRLSTGDAAQTQRLTLAR